MLRGKNRKGNKRNFEVDKLKRWINLENEISMKLICDISVKEEEEKEDGNRKKEKLGNKGNRRLLYLWKLYFRQFSIVVFVITALVIGNFHCLFILIHFILFQFISF